MGSHTQEISQAREYLEVFESPTDWGYNLLLLRSIQIYLSFVEVSHSELPVVAVLVLSSLHFGPNSVLGFGLHAAPVPRGIARACVL
jgi:hypothetical protein